MVRGGDAGYRGRFGRSPQGLSVACGGAGVRGREVHAAHAKFCTCTWVQGLLHFWDSHHAPQIVHFATFHDGASFGRLISKMAETSVY